MENVLRGRVGDAAGIIRCAEICWLVLAEIGRLERLQT